MLRTAGVLHVEPRLAMMPSDSTLGPFEAEFAGMLGIVEERPDENEGGRGGDELLAHWGVLLPGYLPTPTQAWF